MLVLLAIPLLIIIAPPNLHSASLNTTGIVECEQAFYNCTWQLGPPGNTNCTVPFEECMSERAYLQPQKSEECYLAESAWNNLRISAWFSSSVFFFSTILFPAILKGGAKTITKFGTYNVEEDPIRGRLGSCCLYFTDDNGDGKVTASELTIPQTIFAFSSVALPVYQWFTANDAQAKCDYQNSLPP